MYKCIVEILWIRLNKKIYFNIDWPQINDFNFSKKSRKSLNFQPWLHSCLAELVDNLSTSQLNKQSSYCRNKYFDVPLS